MDMDLNIQNKKLELIQWLSTIEDSSIIDKIMDLRKRETEDWWLSISEDEKQSIEKGLEDAETGKLNPHSSARKLYEKWL
jgi:predicted transcriptional regulator